jgi:hypothetical protein
MGMTIADPPPSTPVSAEDFRSYDPAYQELLTREGHQLILKEYEPKIHMQWAYAVRLGWPVSDVVVLMMHRDDPSVTDSGRKRSKAEFFLAVQRGREPLVHFFAQFRGWKGDRPRLKGPVLYAAAVGPAREPIPPDHSTVVLFMSNRVSVIKFPTNPAEVAALCALGPPTPEEVAHALREAGFLDEAPDVHAEAAPEAAPDVAVFKTPMGTAPDAQDPTPDAPEPVPTAHDPAPAAPADAPTGP